MAQADSPPNKGVGIRPGFFAPNPLNRPPLNPSAIGPMDPLEKTVIYCTGWGWYDVKHVRYVKTRRRPLQQIDCFQSNNQDQTYLQYFSKSEEYPCFSCHVPHGITNFQRYTGVVALCNQQSWLKNTVGPEDPTFQRIIKKLY